MIPADNHITLKDYNIIILLSLHGVFILTIVLHTFRRNHYTCRRTLLLHNISNDSMVQRIAIIQSQTRAN